MKGPDKVKTRKILNPALDDNDYVKALTSGLPRISLVKEKIFPGCVSDLAVGSRLDGTLRFPISVGHRIRFQDTSNMSSSIISVKVQDDGAVLLRTETSVYRLFVYNAHLSRLRALQYLKRGYLNFDEEMPDGFFDGGHDAQFYVGSNGNLEVESFDRELIVVDSKIDKELKLKVDHAIKFLSSATDLRTKIQMLAIFVSNSLGGSKMAQPGSIHISELNEADMSTKTRSFGNVNNVLLLGCLNYGVCRHRAILFKYLADRVGIPSRLIRGKLHTGGWHVWNVVCINGKNYVVDVMQQPWNLIEEGSPEVDIYMRVTHERGQRVLHGMGGESIKA